MLVASVVCAVAPSFGVLITARVVQGAGAALVVPSSLALLNGTLRTEDRAPGIGVWAGLASLGTLAGPFVGGWLVDHASWRAIFLLNVPLLLGAILALLPVPESGATGGRLSLDGVGAALAVVGLAGVIDGVDRRHQARLDEPQGARRTGRGSGVSHRAGADRAPSPRSDAEAVAVRVASVLRDQCRDRPALRSPVRGDLPAHPAVRAHPGVHGRAGGRRAYPVLRDLHRAFPCQWGRAGAGRPAPAHDRRHGHLRPGLPVASPGPLRELCRGDPARCGPLGCRAGLGGDPADCRRAGPRSATPTSARPPPSTTSPPVWAEPS